MTAMEELQACLDQKKILLTLLLNLSRQIEVQCAYEEPDDPSPLIFQRQVYLERLKKCVDRIAQVLEKLPDKEHERMTLVFSSRLPMAQCSAEERGASECEVECRSLLREISVSDAESKRQLKKECDRLQKLVSDSRGKGRKNSLFF